MKRFIRQHSDIIAIAAAGLVFRLWQIGWGLPELYEEATPLTVAWKFWNWGRPGLVFDPNFFNYPALTFYIQFLVQAVHYLAGSLVGAYGSVDAFGSTINSVVIPARLVSVCFDTGSLLLTFAIVRQFADRRTALIAGALIAVNPLLTSEAHLIQTDTPLAFFALVALYGSVRLYRDPLPKWYVIAGLGTGLAAASKYPGAMLFLVVVGAHLLRSRSGSELKDSFNNWHLPSAALTAATVFFLANPFILLNFQGFRRDFAFESYHISYGHLGIDTSESSVAYYLGGILPSYLGWLFLILLVFGVVRIIMKGDRQLYIILLLPVVYFFMISTWEMRAARYTLPVLPALIMIGAWGIQEFTAIIKRKSAAGDEHKGRLSYVPAVIAGIVMLQPLFSTGKYLYSLGLTDSRSTTKQWILGHLPAGSAVATGPFGVELPESYQTLEIPFLAVGTEAASPFYDTRWYEDLDCVIASDFDYARYAADPGRYKNFLPYYDSLKNRWVPMFTAGPASGENGPSLWLFRYPDSLRHAAFDQSLFARLEGDPESARVSIFLKSLNAILYQRGRWEKCEQILKSVLQVEVENLEARNMLASVYLQEGKYNPALRQLQLSIQANANQPAVFAMAGRALLRLNQLKEAEATLQRARALNPSMTSTYEDLAALYSQTRQTEQQKRILTEYLTILPQGSPESEKIAKQLELLR